MSLDIKTFRPQKRIPIYVHRCQDCLETVLHSQVAESHSKFKEDCQGKLELGGSFHLTLEYTAPKELKTFMYKDESEQDMIRHGELATKKIVGWDELVIAGKELKFDKNKVGDLIEAIPGLLELVWVLSATRSLFGLPDIENFAKNLNGQSNGKTSTKMEVSQPTAQRA